MVDCMEQDLAVRLKDSSDVGQKSDDGSSTSDSAEGETRRHCTDDSQHFNVQRTVQFNHAVNGLDSSITGLL